MSEHQSRKPENRSEIQERKKVMFSPEFTANEAEKLLTQLGGERRGKVEVDRATRRVNAHLPNPMSPGRLYDIWRKETLPKSWEMDAIRAAAGVLVEEAKNELAELDARIARCEALLCVQDQDFHRPAVDALRSLARGQDRPLDRSGIGIDRPSGLEGSE